MHPEDKNFDWLTADEGERIAGSVTSAPHRRERRLLAWLLVLVLILSLGYLGYQQLQRRAERRLDATTEDVRASHGVVRDAARTGDNELFIQALSAADLEWAGTQQRLVEEQQWLERDRLGLDWDDTSPLSTTINVNTDFTEAEVVAAETYSRTSGTGQIETITLLQTAVYRVGRDRWVYAPPAPQFWGEQETMQQSLLHLTYPERDQAIALRLAGDVNDLCSEDIYRIGLCASEWL